MRTMIIELTDPADERIEPYRDLNQRNLTRYSRRFIAEGDKVVERLVVSDFPVESLLLEERFLSRFAPLVPPDVPVYTGPQRLLEQIIGFHFHRGALACGRRKESPPLNPVAEQAKLPCTLVVCPDVQDPTNLGSIIRTSAAFGASGMLLGSHCADPFCRRVLRVSMGAAFRMPVLESADLAADLRLLRERFGYELIATVTNSKAEPLQTVPRPERLAILLGGEGHGLTGEWLALATRQVTIPMDLGIDSLNVAIAAAVVLYHFQR